MPVNYVLLETIQLTQTATSITFDNLPSSGYTDLKIVCSVRGTGSSNYIGANLLLNGTSASTNWSRVQLEGGDGTVAGYTSTSSSIGYFPDGNFTANAFGTSIIYIPNYRSSNYKTINVESAGEAASTTAVYMDIFTQTWSNTSAITSIQMGNASSALAVGCTFSLYGIAALGTTPTAGPKASGGNIIETDGTYWTHTFLSSGVFTPAVPITCDYLVIAGGGGGAAVSSGGNYSAPGGGAGGYRTSAGTSGGGASAESQLSLIGTSYPVMIGAGSPAGNFSGSDSIFGSITSVGGGGTPSKNGGSGGGAFDFGTTTPGTGTAGQGYAGGAAASATSAGGGGGAGGAGSSSRTGGAGVASSITGTSVTRAGGGGAGWGGTATGGGGAGGGANTTQNGTAGTANTGGGGGGASVSGSYASGGAGGSGIVVVRYAV